MYTPALKFYAMLLMLKVSENHNTLLMRRLAKSTALLDRLFKDCQTDFKKPAEQKGRRYFSKNPNDEEYIIGNNLVNLIIESFKYWYHEYQTPEPKTSLKIYEIIMRNLKDRMTFPEEYAYVGETEFKEDHHLYPYEKMVFLRKQISD